MHEAMNEETRMREAIRLYMIQNLENPPKAGFFACACLGPMNGEPECPCGMRNIFKVEGVFYRVSKNEQGEPVAKRY